MLLFLLNKLDLEEVIILHRVNKVENAPFVEVDVVIHVFIVIIQIVFLR